MGLCEDITWPSSVHLFPLRIGQEIDLMFAIVSNYFDQAYHHHCNQLCTGFSYDQLMNYILMGIITL